MVVVDASLGAFEPLKVAQEQVSHQSWQPSLVILLHFLSEEGVARDSDGPFKSGAITAVMGQIEACVG